MKIIAALVFLLYPLLVYFCISHGIAWGVIGIIGLYVIYQSIHSWLEKHFKAMLAWLAIFGFMLIGSNLSKEITIKIFPVFANLGFMGIFAMTLWQGPPLIERFARITFPDTPEKIVRYCRLLTKIWVAFFAIQAVITLLLAYFATNAVWAIYTGVVSYILIFALLAGEYIFRRWHFSDLEIPSPTDSAKEIWQNYRKIFRKQAQNETRPSTD